ncbi:diversity-generating retroelement protein Avd [Patescibacteria group bacterium]|nr:diversity-generating retroelement protein Avd [Patescibacteria group bacterium]MBU1922063.1 diversity-generating retroelement protein Avd [Patescibacteria group bacterium]
MNHKNIDIPIIKALYDLYKIFYSYSILFPKKDKYTLGAKCEIYIISTLELLLEAGCARKEEKLSLIKKANAKFDTLKLFIRLLKDLDIISNKKYINLQKQIQEIGCMLGGWQRSLT